MLGPNEVVRPESSAVEIVLKLGSQAIIEVDDEGDGPPILWIRTGLIDFMVTPFAASEGGQLTKCDLDRASDWVMAGVAYRTAIYNQLVDAGVITPQVPRRERLNRRGMDRFEASASPSSS